MRNENCACLFLYLYISIYIYLQCIIHCLCSSFYKGKLIGSIYAEKLVYSKNKYRTPKLKDGASFIFNNTKALQG